MIVSAQLKLAIDRYEILSFLEHMQFEADVTKLCRIGQPNLDIGSRRLIFEVENAIDKKKLLKSAYQLKTQKNSLEILLSRGLNEIEIEQEI